MQMPQIHWATFLAAAVAIVVAMFIYHHLARR